MKKLTMSLCMLVGLCAQAASHGSPLPSNYVESRLTTKSFLSLNSFREMNVSSENGTLVFKDYGHLSDVMSKLSELSQEERIRFEDSINFRSLESIEYLVNEAEVNNLEIFFAGVDPNLSREEYEKMGYFYEYTSLYKDYLDKGVIEQILEKDGSESFELFVKVPHYSTVLNEKGELRVGEETFIFKGFELNVLSKDGEVVRTIDYKKNSMDGKKMAHDLKEQDDWWWIWTYDGNDKRYRMGVIQYTLHEDVYFFYMSSEFYAFAKGQNKRFFSWKYRNGYKPVYSIGGHWTTTFKAKSCAACPVVTNPWPLLDLNDPWEGTTPYSWSAATDPDGMSNDFKVFLQPNETWHLYNGWIISEDIHSRYTMYFSFSGGSSGYFYTLSN